MKTESSEARLAYQLDVSRARADLLAARRKVALHEATLAHINAANDFGVGSQQERQALRALVRARKAASL
jgi:hypothetical protein